MSIPDRSASAPVNRAARQPATGTTVTGFTKVPVPAAIDALGAATVKGTEPATVLCAVADTVIPWLLTAAEEMVRVAAVVFWVPDLADADGYGLCVATHEGGLYRFATDPPTGVRRLHIVREAS